VALDPLVGQTTTTAPSSIAGTRYVYIDSKYLEGPSSPGGSSVTYNFSESDSQLSTTGTTTTQGYSVATTNGGNVDFGIFKLSFSRTNTWTWSNTYGSARSDGTTHTANVTFGSSTYTCAAYVDIYEDTMFHTFAFRQPSSGCSNAIRASAESEQGSEAFSTQSSETDGTKAVYGSVLDQQGRPVAGKTVVLTWDNGEIRRMVTNRRGEYFVGYEPRFAGPVKLQLNDVIRHSFVQAGSPVQENFIGVE
ncbi:MAG TPA: carboxypeptidase-like regulatory domain-containing protein, partial [Acidobacteriaceae bacterium]|nr:carboxypeptidase-like regulatory domain-containing protein [Acidobacteriaceae bacterium]